MRWRSWGVGMVCLALVAAGAGGAQAKRLAGVIPDVSGHGARISRAPEARAAVLPYGGGPVLHANRTHVIFWEPAGSGLTFDPGYIGMIETFLRRVAADSHRPTNVYG